MVWIHVGEVGTEAKEAQAGVEKDTLIQALLGTLLDKLGVGRTCTGSRYTWGR